MGRRPFHWGAIDRSQHYVFPRPAYLRVAVALAAGALLVAGLIFFEIFGALVAPLRQTLMPGALIARHSTVRSCEECHVPRRGVSNFRCQRCHDESGPGRRTQLAHVGRHDPAALMAGRVEDVNCVRCHVEHRGRDAALAVVDQAQCNACHGAARVDAAGPRPRLSDFAGHPEFRLVAQGAAPTQHTGVQFSHKVHLKQTAKDLTARQIVATGQRLCEECHKVDFNKGQAGHRDFEPQSAEAHCLRCHRDQLKMEAAPAEELVAAGGVDPFTCDPKQFDCAGELAAKRGVVHRDEWVLHNVRKLRRELYPAEHAREYADLLGQSARLRRRLFLAQPLAGISAERLAERREGFRSDFEKLSARIQQRELATKADGAAGEQQRLREAAAAGAASGLSLDVETAKPGPLSPDDFQARREELLQLLDAVSTSEGADAGRRGRAAYLRLRLLSLSPGEDALEGLRRARRQRGEDLARVEDEERLRQGGVPASALDTGLRDVERALDRTRARLAELAVLGVLPEARPEDRPRKEKALAALVGEAGASGCAKCHEITRGTFAPVAAARPVLTLATFTHEAHLTATPPAASWWSRRPGPAPGEAAPTSCLSCHGEVDKSEKSAELHLKSVASCRECHSSGRQRDDCQLCHRYHPPSRP
jgi:hypothetical protein